MPTKQAALESETANWTELQAIIKSRYPSMSKRLQQVAAYVLENPNAVMFETIAVLAERMEVPPSTLIRFASALDFSGFNELKSIIKEDVATKTSNYSSRIRLMGDQKHWQGNELLHRFSKTNREALHHLDESISESAIRKSVAMMANSRHIFLLGNGRAHTVASYLHYALNHIDKKVFLISGTGGMFREQMSNLESGDLLLAVSYRPYSTNTTELSAEAADKGAQVLSITDSPVSPLATTSELSLVVQEASIDSFRSLTASLVLAQVLVVSLAHRESGLSPT